MWGILRSFPKFLPNIIVCCQKNMHFKKTCPKRSDSWPVGPRKDRENAAWFKYHSCIYLRRRNERNHFESVLSTPLLLGLVKKINMTLHFSGKVHSPLQRPNKCQDVSLLWHAPPLFTPCLMAQEHHKTYCITGCCSHLVFCFNVSAVLNRVSALQINWSWWPQKDVTLCVLGYFCESDIST